MYQLKEYVKTHGLDKLKDDFSITTKTHPQYPNLHMFNYDQVESPFLQEVVRQSRGIILDRDNDWSPVCYTYDKFFNEGSGHCSNIDWDSALVYEKFDGSLMQLYYYDEQWHIASSGIPDGSGFSK